MPKQKSIVDQVIATLTPAMKERLKRLKKVSTYQEVPSIDRRHIHVLENRTLRRDVYAKLGHVWMARLNCPQWRFTTLGLAVQRKLEGRPAKPRRDRSEFEEVGHTVINGKRVPIVRPKSPLPSLRETEEILERETPDHD